MRVVLRLCTGSAFKMGKIVGKRKCLCAVLLHSYWLWMIDSLHGLVSICYMRQPSKSIIRVQR